MKEGREGARERGRKEGTFKGGREEGRVISERGEVGGEMPEKKASRKDDADVREREEKG
jgi:hypothetical protein